jgi:hypothetical protein
LKMTAVLDASQVSAGRDSRAGILAAAYAPPIPGNKLTLTANAGFAVAEPKTGESVDDIKLGAGLSYDLRDNIGFSLDYTLDNDVDGEDDYSLSIYQALGDDGELVYGAGKHGVIFASYKLNFTLR